ncbi:MAG: hypothetical protein L3J47_00570 [Sulfurovum sp.]|nr:hypothetical protein [Sulfurovum sp.]
MELEFSTLYRSNTVSHVVEEETVVTKAVLEGVVASTLRMSGDQGVVRGVMKSTSGNLHYFTLNMHSDRFTISKAQSGKEEEDLETLFDSMDIECSLAVKAEGQTMTGIASVKEEDALAQDRAASVEVHPGAAMVSTTDRPEVGRKWHEDAFDKSWDASALLTELNTALQKSTGNARTPLSEQESQFMAEVLGETQENINSGNVQMRPVHKVMYRQWLGKSMHDSVSDLKGWLSK